MRTREVELPSIKDPIKASPGFEKKGLATHKLDVMGKCGFSCSYCSTAATTFVRVNREKWADEAERQLGERLYPNAPHLTYRWPDFEERLDAQLATKPVTDDVTKRWGYGKTLVYSQLTDAFSPWAVAEGLTRRTLEKVFRLTGFRVRALTKNAVVGNDEHVEFFLRHRDRVVVGLSIGSRDDAWARRVEVGTSSPTARNKALRRLQDAGVPTFGMLCPVFPDMLRGDGVERLVEAIRPELCETVWSEPYNDRANWRAVADGHEDPEARATVERMFSGRDARATWSRYARRLYERVHTALSNHDAARKHRYLIYQDGLLPADREALRDAEGVLFQSAEKSIPVVQ